MKKLKLIKITEKSKFLILTLLLCCIPRFYVAVQMVPMRTLSDETASIVSAAYLAGNNWSSVIENSGYYGFGFYWIFFPLFYIIQDSLVLYKAILLICSIIQGFSALIPFFILDKYFKIKNNLVKSLFSIICSYMVVTRVSIIYNENILNVISWIIALLVCQLIEDSINDDLKMKRKHTVIFLCVLLYSLTIHVRALTYFFAFIIICLLFRVIKRKALVSHIFIPFFLVGYSAVQFVINKIQNVLWSASGNELRNASVGINKEINYLNMNAIKSMFSIWIGQITTITIFSCGLFLCTSIIIVFTIISYVKKKKYILDDEELFILMVGVFFLLCIGATILAQSVTWLSGVMNGFINDISDKNYYSYKAFTYVRYFGPYVAPFIMAGLGILYHNYQLLYKNRVWLIISFIMMKSYWVAYLLPYMAENASAREVFIPFSLSHSVDSTSIYTYLSGFFVTSLFIIGIVICKNFAHFRKLIIICIGVMIFQYYYPAIYQDKEIASNNYEKIDKSYRFMVENKDVFSDYSIENIYVIDTNTKKDHQNYYLFQFYLRGYRIIPEIPTVRDELTIIFSVSSILSELGEDKNYIEVQLDEKEYVYIHNSLYNKATIRINN